MRVKYLSKFLKDLDKIKTSQVKEAILEVIIEVKSANSLKNINNLKKLLGHKNAYRIRCGQYRIGFFLIENVIHFARAVHRKDIYKLFP
jgi:mRNA interferase RelE/StbE